MYHVESIDHVFGDVVYAKTTLAPSTSRLGGYYSLSSHRRVSFSVTLFHPGSMNETHVQRHLVINDIKWVQYHLARLSCSNSSLRLSSIPLSAWPRSLSQETSQPRSKHSCENLATACLRAARRIDS
jgi:hypothetical protein